MALPALAGIGKGLMGATKGLIKNRKIIQIT